VENMAGFQCPHCHETTPIFGEGGGQKLAEEFGLPVLGSIPIDLETRVGGDTGAPIVVARPRSAQADAFRRVAEAVAGRLSTLSVLKLPTTWWAPGAATLDPPVFPPPGVVFSRGAGLPLLVSDPRSGAMIGACLAGARLRAVAMLRPGGGGDSPGRPPLHAVAGVG